MYLDVFKNGIHTLATLSIFPFIALTQTLSNAESAANVIFSEWKVGMQGDFSEILASSETAF